MTENELRLLGFTQEFIREHDDDETYYYALDIVDGLTLITKKCNDEIVNDSWEVSIFNTDPEIRWDSFGELQGFINSVTNKIVHAK